MKKSGCRAMTVLLLAVWPLIVHLDMARTRLSDQPWFPDVEIQADFFMHIRSVLFLILACVMLVLLIGDICLSVFNKKGMNTEGGNAVNKNTSILLLLTGITALCIIISSVCSSWREMAFHGSFEQYETCPVLLGCLAVFWFFRWFRKECSIL